MGLFDKVQLSHVNQTSPPIEDFVNIGSQYKDLYMQGAQEENQLRYALTDLVVNADPADKEAVEQLVSNFDQRLQQRVENDQYYNPSILNQVRHDAATFKAQYQPFAESKQRRDADRSMIAQMKNRTPQEKAMLMSAIDSTPGVSFDDRGIPVSSYEHAGFADAANLSELADKYGYRIQSDSMQTTGGTYYTAGEDDPSGLPAGTLVKRTGQGSYSKVTPQEARKIITDMVKNDAEVKADLGTRTRMLQNQGYTLDEIAQMNHDYIEQGIDPAVQKYSYSRGSRATNFTMAPGQTGGSITSPYAESLFLPGERTAVNKDIATNLDAMLKDPAGARLRQSEKYKQELNMQGAGTFKKPIYMEYPDRIVSEFPENPTVDDYKKLMDEETYSYVENKLKSSNLKWENVTVEQLQGAMAEVRDRLEVASDYLSTPITTYSDKTIQAQNESFENSLLVRARSVYNADDDELVDTKKFRKALADPDEKAKVRLIGEVGPANPYYERTGNPAFAFGKVFSYDGKTYVVPMDARSSAAAGRPEVMARHLAYQSMYDGKIHDVLGIGTVEYNRDEQGGHIIVDSGGRKERHTLDEFFSGMIPQSINE